jgi:putative protease
VLSVSSDLKHVRVAAEVGMERFDGLRIVPPARAFFSTPQHGGGGGKGGRGGAQEGLMYDKYSNDLPEFSLRGMRRGKAKVYEVEAGEVVEVELPAELRGRLKAEGRRIAQGDLLFKTRSNELKRRVEALAVVPQDYKPRQWDVLSEVRVALRADHPSPGLLTLQASAWKLGELVLEEGLELPLTPATREGARESLIGDIAEALGTFGDAGVRAAAVRVEGLPAPGDVSAAVPFVPRKELKALKQSIARSIGPALQAMLEGRREAAVEALVRAPAKAPRRLQPVGWGERRFAIKVDRFEYLEELERYLGERGEGARALIEEVVFEPKRMFLGETRGQEGAARLLEFSRRMGVGVRLALNTVVRAWDERPLEGWVRAFAEQSRAQGGGLAPRFETGNLGALGLLEAWGIMDGGDVDLATDFTMYALNSCASEEMARMGARRVALSVEDDRENLREHTERWAVPPEQARPQTIIFKVRSGSLLCPPEVEGVSLT